MKTSDKSSRLRRLALLGAVLALLACWSWLRQASPEDQTASSAPDEPMPAPVVVAEPRVDLDPVVASSIPDPAEAEFAATDRQLAGTHHMVAAHAPLRTPEVADPDSSTNREILNSMVTKALARSKESETPSSP